MNSTEPVTPKAAESWSSSPHGTPTKSFSARCARRASAARGRSATATPASPASARPAAHSSAADEDRPAPTGTVEAIARSAPPKSPSIPASSSAQATPAGYAVQPRGVPGDSSLRRTSATCRGSGQAAETSRSRPSVRGAAATAV